MKKIIVLLLIGAAAPALRISFSISSKVDIAANSGFKAQVHEVEPAFVVS